MFLKKGVFLMAKFAEVTLENVEQGQFLKNCEKQFREMQSDLIKFVKENHEDGTATLTIKVGIKSSDNGGSYSIVTDIDKKLPRKKAVTTALPERGEDDDLCLWANIEGTNEDTPLQQQLCKADGSPIEPIKG
jgi:hypothetical protein